MAVRSASALQQAEDAFRSAADEPDWRFIADSIPHIVWMAGPDGSTEYFNRRGTEYTGLEPEANYGWGWVALVHPDDADMARRGWEAAVRSGEAYDLEYRIRRSDGEFRWHAFRSLPVRGSDGEVERWIGTATDIEERKTLELAVAEAQREAVEASTFLAALHAAAPVGLAFVDRAFRVVRMNDELAAIIGPPPEQHLGRTIAEVAPDVWPHVEPIFRHVLDTGETLRNVLALASPAPDRGGLHEWLASYYPVSIDGEVIGVGVVTVDVTERTQPEQFSPIGALPTLRERRAKGRTAYLTDREREVLASIAEGLPNRAVAERLHITTNTVRNHVQRILYKLGVHSRLEAVVVAAREQVADQVVSP